MEKAILIIDVQNDYFSGGAHSLYDPEKAVKNAALVLEKARDRSVEIVYIQHVSINEGADFFLPDTYGIEINDWVKPNEGEKIITKNYPNSFRETDLLEHLQEKKIKELIVFGMMTDVCIDATVRAAKDLGFKITVICDACTTEDRELNGQLIKALDVHVGYLAGLSALGNFYADVITAKEFLNA
ncbi:cysteine hydrolase family protein [Chryseobacterium paridis]|uniref:Cysteine hydrolase n=1 Tax=Chryseobacterium paridis TaxID=2800328 RepID=A0ABS1FVI1_9FLAO|nr:cysteine hydrolase family protein [Chryseobacterium paridis]MBK1896455.1 cysteine hydrolase [Chryseobacterium paridis]